MKKLYLKAIAFMLPAALMLTGFTNLAFATETAPAEGVEESLGASAACEGHFLGTFSGVPACVNETGDLHVCENNFPNENFRDYVLTLNGADDKYLTTDEISSIEYISVINNSAITNIYGIEYFILLKELRCSYLSLNNLNLSNNTVLEHLSCHGNDLTKLDISNNVFLTYLSCHNNKLTELIVSMNRALTYLDCSYNQLTLLDISANTALTHLNCVGNKLIELNASNQEKLEILKCDNNQIEKLDIKISIELKELYCTSNKLTELNVSNNTNLTKFYCSKNQLTNLNVGENKSLQWLYCDNNLLRDLDVSNNKNLVCLSCPNNQLTKLDVSKNNGLQWLYCQGNHLTELNVSNTRIKWFNYNLQIVEHCTLSEDNKWIVDMSKLVSPSNFERITSFSQGTFDSETGLITFDSKPSSFTYTYDVGKDDKTMTVTVNLIDHVHTFSDWQVRTPATCTEKGEEYRTCACGEEETREITALGHSFTNYVSNNNATCTKNGTETAKCDRCDATDTREAENSALGHNYSTEWTIDKEPTCTEPGSQSHHCTRCEDKTDITEIPATGHSFGEWVVEKPASMTEDGLEVRICSACQKREEKILPAGAYLPGDLNGDGKVTDEDATYLLMHTFYPEDYPVRQDCDFNHDGEITDEDASYLLYYTFFPDDYPLIKH